MECSTDCNQCLQNLDPLVMVLELIWLNELVAIRETVKSFKAPTARCYFRPSKSLFVADLLAIYCEIGLPAHLRHIKLLRNREMITWYNSQFHDTFECLLEC